MFHSSGCSRNYVQLYDGASIEPGNLSDMDLTMTEENLDLFSTHFLTVYYHTDGSNVANNARGLEVNYNIHGKYPMMK